MREWIAHNRAYDVLTALNIESLIDKIYVYPGKRVEVLFTYSDALVERQVKK